MDYAGAMCRRTTPGDEHGLLRREQYVQNGLLPRGPVFGIAKRRFGPIERPNPLPHFPAPCQERKRTTAGRDFGRLPRGGLRGGGTGYVVRTQEDSLVTLGKLATSIRRYLQHHDHPRTEIKQRVAPPRRAPADASMALE